MVDSAAFSIENRQKILEEATASEYDFVITQCGFKEVLFCLIASGLGFRCALFCEGDFATKLHSVVDTKYADKKSVLNIQQQFPHLILPDEFLHILPEKKRFAGLFSKSIKEKDLMRYESALNLSMNTSVFLEKEFKLNSNRLLMSMIKSAHKQGICILNHAMCEQGKDHQFIVSDALNLTLDSYAIGYKKHIHFDSEEEDPNTELHIYLNKKDLYLKRSLKFRVENKLVRLIRYQDYFHLICESGDTQVDFIKAVLNELSKLFNEDIYFDEDDIISSELVAIDNHTNLKNQLLHLEKYSKKYLDLSGSDFLERMHKIPSIDSHFEGRTEIQDLIEYADFKFDEAKQTGIHPISFKNLFYRFGSEIEQLTELAYEWRAKYGPGEKLWQNVQLWYLYNNEMICSMDDYYARINSINNASHSNLTIDEEIMNKCLFI